MTKTEASKNFRVAGEKKVSHWVALRKNLKPGKNDETNNWKLVFDDFFFERISTRYLEPIRSLQSQKRFRGEGFSIVTVQCALIEFLAATVEGRIYRLQGDDKIKGQFGYSDSAGLFCRFLTTWQPFSLLFKKEEASDFYLNVRCALVHEARTKNGWRILTGAANGLAVDMTNKIIYHEGLQTLLSDFARLYREKLMVSPDLQKGLLRKFDNLCDLPLVAAEYA